MKNVFYTILLFGCIACGLFAACTGGAYNANPGSNSNYVVNPLEPLKASQFTWSVPSTFGSMGGVINGTPWVASITSYTYTAGANILQGSTGSQIMYIYLKNTWAGNLYSMGYKQYNSYCNWSDSVGGQYNVYSSTLGNSGEVNMLINNNDTISGQFYCEGITNSGDIVAINNGYFNLKKY